ILFPNESKSVRYLLLCRCAFRPALVCLDLSGCDFEDQRPLLEALSSLPSLRSLLLEGTPCSLGRSYPGLTLDVLQRLVCLDTQRVSPEEREAFRGIAHVAGAVRECARASVHVGRLRGLPDPEQDPDHGSQTFPVLSFSYYVSYDFISNSPEQQDLRSESEDAADVSDTLESEDPSVCGESSGPTLGSSHSSCKLTWSELMDFSDSHSHSVSDLRALKSFLNQGMNVRVHEEKVLSWPAASEATPKPGPKGAKGKEPPAKGKDKKKRVLPELVQDPPIRRALGSVHVPLHSLLQRGHKVTLCCDFGLQRFGSPPSAANTPDKAGPFLSLFRCFLFPPRSFSIWVKPNWRKCAQFRWG
uniref:Uncharacterized protein n=1 Tax=Neogobius melanostomus TaxID=47308 RepID=A0A8C6SMD0_9GOBI